MFGVHATRIKGLRGTGCHLKPLRQFCGLNKYVCQGKLAMANKVWLRTRLSIFSFLVCRAKSTMNSSTHKTFMSICHDPSLTLVSSWCFSSTSRSVSVCMLWACLFSGSRSLHTCYAFCKQLTCPVIKPSQHHNKEASDTEPVPCCVTVCWRACFWFGFQLISLPLLCLWDNSFCLPVCHSLVVSVFACLQLALHLFSLSPRLPACLVASSACRARQVSCHPQDSPLPSLFPRFLPLTSALTPASLHLNISACSSKQRLCCYSICISAPSYKTQWAKSLH